MLLGRLIEPILIKEVLGETDIDITGINVEANKVKAGELYICLGNNSGLEEAIQNGAAAVLTQTNIDVPSNVTQIKVSDSKRAMAVLLDRFYDHPSHKLNLIGVTGTNGKTTTTTLIEKILRDQGKKTGLIGTIHMKIGSKTQQINRTTPEIFDLQKYLFRMVNEGVEYAIMEVSSHGIDFGRIWGSDFNTAIFTNLTQDHLDYHKTMENYRDVKGRLFAQLGNVYGEKPKCAILNADDKASAHYAKVTSAQIITYGIERNADVRAHSIQLKMSNTRFVVDSFAGSTEINVKLTGKFNVYNALAAIAACLIEGIPLHDIKRSLENVECVKGRFEPVVASPGQDFAVIVDYAHTPDGLENVLKTITQMAEGKIYCVVGCGGDRDKTKRPIMASIAASYADFAIFTSDNPRFEEPEGIINDMISGLPEVAKEKYTAIVDRKEAINYAISQAGPNDWILIAGKGHETYQVIKGTSVKFDDREVAIQAIRNKISP